MGNTRLKKIILRLTPEKVLNFYQSHNKDQFPQLDSYATLSYSQEGEDLILKRIFEGQKTGFYVDVGAHHPKRFSNTYLFYKMGWRGINIDAMPGSMNAFKEMRPTDINIEFPVSDKEEILTFYIFNEPALNTFSYEQAKKKDGYKNFKIERKVRLTTRRLDQILIQNLPANSQIDFISIDVEGFDLNVLKSNDWTQYSPKVILIESFSDDLQDVMRSEIFQFLKGKGYSIFAKSFNTLFFIKRNEKDLIFRKNI